MPLVRSDLDFKLNSVNAYNEGRYLIIEAEVQIFMHLIRCKSNVIFLETLIRPEVTLMLCSTPILTALVATRLKTIPQKYQRFMLRF